MLNIITICWNEMQTGKVMRKSDEIFQTFLALTVKSLGPFRVYYSVCGTGVYFLHYNIPRNKI